MKDSKNLVIGMLCAVVCIMAVAYAAFSTTLTINGSASIASNWSVLIPEGGITCNVTKATGGVDSITVGGEEVKLAATGTATGGTTASFEMTFLQPGDSATCVVTIANEGTLNAKISSLEIVGNDQTGPIRFNVSNIAVDDTLAADATTTFTVTGTYDSSVSDQPDSATSKTLTVTAIYVQDTTA